MPPGWPYILERKFNSLHKNGVHFVIIEGEKGSNLRLSTPALAAFLSFFNIAILYDLSLFKLIPMILTL